MNASRPAEIEAMLADPAVTILTTRDGDTLTGCVAVTVKGAALGYSRDAVRPHLICNRRGLGAAVARRGGGSCPRPRGRRHWR